MRAKIKPIRLCGGALWYTWTGGRTACPSPDWAEAMGGVAVAMGATT